MAKGKGRWSRTPCHAAYKAEHRREKNKLRRVRKNSSPEFASDWEKKYA